MKNSIVLCSLLLLLMACGEGEEMLQATTIIVNPVDLTVTGSSEAADGAQAQAQEYLVQTKTASGAPRGNVKIRIGWHYTKAPNMTDVVSFYDGKIAEGGYLGEGPLPMPYTATTDKRGLYYFSVLYRAGGSLKYDGEIQVVSGPNGTEATFAISNATQ